MVTCEATTLEITLIELWRAKPSLYNTSTRSYKLKGDKAVIHAAIGGHVDMSVEEVQTELCELQSEYCKLVKELQNLEKGGKSYIPCKYRVSYLMKEIIFLQPYVALISDSEIKQAAEDSNGSDDIPTDPDDTYIPKSSNFMVCEDVQKKMESATDFIQPDQSIVPIRTASDIEFDDLPPTYNL